MFNPYVSRPEDALRPVRRPQKAPEGILGRLGRLERDDLLILTLIYLLAREGDPDRIWPLAAVLLYLLL